MRTHRLVMLGAVTTALATAAAGPFAGSYTLEELRAIARARHPTLEAAEAAVRSAEGALRQARAYPNIDLVMGGGRGRARDGGDSRPEGRIGLIQPIEVPGVRRWRTRAAELGLRGAEIERALAETVIDSTVSRLVYSVLLEQRRVAIARETAGVAARLHDLLARRVELGESSPLEATRARSEWFARRRDVIDARAGLEAARSALDLFCGGRLGDRFEVAEALEGAEVHELPSDLVERMRAGNPILLRAGVAVREADAGIESARRDVFPRFFVAVDHETELDRVSNGVGVVLTLPLWNRNRGAIEASVAARDLAAAEARAWTLEQETALDRSIADYRRAAAALRLHREGWTAAARRSLEIATFSFENGEASLLEVLDAQRSNLEVAFAEAASWAELALARAEIERLIGGALAPEETDEAQ